jgi:hypothetical protein
MEPLCVLKKHISDRTEDSGKHVIMIIISRLEKIDVGCRMKIWSSEEHPVHKISLNNSRRKNPTFVKAPAPCKFMFVFIEIF